MSENVMSAGRKITKQVSPLSEAHSLAKLDGRRRESRLMRDVRRDLITHCGGKPSVPERLIIDRIARTALRLELFDRKMAEGALTDHDGRVYGALHNSFRLMLRELGLKAVAPPAPTLAEIRSQAA